MVTFLRKQPLLGVPRKQLRWHLVFVVVALSWLGNIILCVNGAMVQPPLATTTATTKTTTTPTKVLVTGASGRTGQLVFQALLHDSRFDPKALVRSERSAKKLRKAVPGTGLDQIVICDITNVRVVGSKGEDDHAANADPTQFTVTTPRAGLEGCQAMVICTSAVPVVSKVSLLKAFCQAPFNLLRGKKAMDFRQFQFVWQNRQYPELVDYRGQVAQINLAKQLHMKQVVVVGSMGGTDPTNFLNAVGKNRKDGTGNGDILLWKRKAERYLVAQSDFLDYSIIHPGGLIDTPAGLENFVLDVNDKLLQNKKRSISREDVANLCVAALVLGRGHKLSFDCITAAPPEGGSTDKIRTAEEALADFMKQAKKYDYAL